MLLVPYYLGASAIEGVGLFAKRDVRAGEMIYQFDTRFVMVIADSELAKMPEVGREAVLRYSYRGAGKERLGNAMYYCADDSRFFNHDDDPNVRWNDAQEAYIAVRDIPAKTEFTCDYREFSEQGDWSMC
jgi:SET domain-containing protein